MIHVKQLPCGKSLKDLMVFSCFLKIRYTENCVGILLQGYGLRAESRIRNGYILQREREEVAITGFETACREMSGKKLAWKVVAFSGFAPFFFAFKILIFCG